MDLVRARGVDLDKIIDASDISDFDRTQVCPYFGYPDLKGDDGYYADMAAAGAGDAKGLRKLANGDAPMLLLHAKDDPIIPYDAQLPRDVAKASNLVLLGTDVGGHTGWPRGLDPRQHRWTFMIDLAIEFAVAALASKPFKVDLGDGPVFDANFQVRQTHRSRLAKAGKLPS